MKATGIVRRIDDLGRVVIPKEIRRTMRIREGDPLEIFTNNEGEVIFKKYSPMGEMVSFAADFAEAISNSSNLAVLICDRDHCIAVGGTKKKFIEQSITQDLEKIIEDRRLFVNKENASIFALADCEQKICVAVPIIAAGDIIGCIVLIESEKASSANETDIKLAEAAAHFLSSRNE